MRSAGAYELRHSDNLAHFKQVGFSRPGENERLQSSQGDSAGPDAEQRCWWSVASWSVIFELGGYGASGGDN